MSHIVTRYVLRMSDGRYYVCTMGRQHYYTDNPWGAFHRSSAESVVYHSIFGRLRGNRMIQAGQLSVQKIEREI